MTVKKFIFVVLGCICLTLGTVGVILPIFPTVPFYLATAFCFANSSERLHSSHVYHSFVFLYRLSAILPISQLFQTQAISVTFAGLPITEESATIPGTMEYGRTVQRPSPASTAVRWITITDTLTILRSLRQQGKITIPRAALLLRVRPQSLLQILHQHSLLPRKRQLKSLRKR